MIFTCVVVDSNIKVSAGYHWSTLNGKTKCMNKGDHDGNG